MNNQTAYIVVNGNLMDSSFVLSKINPEDLIIAADGGLNTIRDLGLTAHAAIGDLDSASQLPLEIEALEGSNEPKAVDVEGTTYLKYLPEKDYLDTELAIDYVVSKGAQQIRLINVVGDEIDHMLATISMITKSKYAEIDLKILTKNQTMYPATGHIKLFGSIGEKISLTPLNGEVVVHSSSGLKYDPSQYVMTMETNTGIRNEFTKVEAMVEVTSGSFLITEYND